MSDIWHKKTEQPEKKLYCTRLIVTKWGSVFDEKDIDSGAFIETDWAYLDDLLACEQELDRTRKALGIAQTALVKLANDAYDIDEHIYIDGILNQIERITKGGKDE